MGFTIRGTILRSDTGLGMADMIVEAYDADLFLDDLLGRAQTDGQGAFSVKCPTQSGINDLPDVYVQVKTSRGQLLHTTRHQIITDVSEDISLNVTIGLPALIKTGLEEPERLERPGQEIDLKSFTFRADGDRDNPLLAQTYEDLKEQGSILELFKFYKETLDRSADNDDPVYAKLAALFDVARTPDEVLGHYYGVTLGIRMGDMPESMAEYGNVLGLIWGSTLSDECPWVGKSLSPIEPSRLKEITGRSASVAEPALLGINHFNRIHTRILNPLAFQLLNVWMDLHPAHQEEQKIYNWERNGAYFIGRHAISINAQSPRPVFQLNYRYKPLGNRAPNCWLIDELVEISPGLFLGQLCYATRKLLRDYEPERPSQNYRYRNFGYFLLLDNRWHGEARRLFPYLEIPPDAPGMQAPKIDETIQQAKFNTFTFEEPPLPICNDAVLKQAQAESEKYPTILHYLKNCSQSLQDNLSNESAYFEQLGALFDRGIAPETMDGFYYGALVSWKSAAIFDLFGLNTINLLYTSVGAPFSTWTGKRFDPISTERLQEITDGHETGQVATSWGANTQALRTLKERFVGRMMGLADIRSEEATPEEKQQLGYDVKNFFFIARQAQSISPQSTGKQVFQLNYRWPKLETIIPDCYCIDELVQIAQGLFLGRLLYATNIVEPYNPEKDPSIYRYELFGYFLLMDRQWQQIRLSIGYDLHNI
jgi:hypothetical protein